MPKVELAIRSTLVTVERKRSHTRLEYQDLPVLQIPSELFSSQNPSPGSLKSFSILVLYQNLRHLEENLLDRGVFIRPPANFRQSFAYFSAILCKPCSQKSRFFLLQRNFSPYTWRLPGCLLGF